MRLQPAARIPLLLIGPMNLPSIYAQPTLSFEVAAINRPFGPVRS